MRLFIAIEIPEDVSHILNNLQKLLPTSAHIKKASSFHITLKFIGEVKNWQSIAERLHSVQFKKFKLRLNNIGAFPNENTPRILWAGIKENEELNILKRRIDETLPEYGNDKKFIPHITLARIKGQTNTNISKIRRSFREEMKAEFDVDRFSLFRSVLTPAGPVYNTLEQYYAKDF